MISKSTTFNGGETYFLTIFTLILLKSISSLFLKDPILHLSIHTDALNFKALQPAVV